MAAIALLDLANSGDFAANIFNEIPVPHFAIVLMVLGATCALIMSIVAFIDARRSLRNLCLLREERRMLLAQDEESAASEHSCAAELDLNHRDIWTEFFDRAAMEIMMGIAAFLIAVGTYMAPGGADHRVFKASNLLSGYIGNSLPAAYGAITCSWSAYVLWRTRRHAAAAKAGLEDGPVLSALRTRVFAVQEHAIITGVTCLVSGILSMFTPTSWWPYPVLLVCGLIFIYGAYAYRRHIGYERPQILVGVRIEVDVLVDELTWIASMRKFLKSGTAFTDKTDADMVSLHSLTNLIIRCDLFQYFSTELIKDPQLSGLLLADNEEEIDIYPDTLYALPTKHHDQIREIAQTCLKKRGLRQLRYRKHFLLEALGSSLAVSYAHERNKKQEK